MRIGIYYIITQDSDLERRINDFHRIKSLDVNAVATYLLFTDHDRHFVRKCVSDGIDIFAERQKQDYDLSKLTKMMNEYGSDIKGIIAYDDVDSPKTHYRPEDVANLITEIKSRWPDKEVVISGGYVDKISSYRDCGQDNLLFQGYPIGNGAQKCEDAGLSYWAAASDYFAPNWSAICQTFRWENQRYPTQEEVRSMVYQALAYRTKEVWFYCYYDGYNDMTRDPARKNQLRNIISEIRLAEKFWEGWN